MCIHAYAYMHIYVYYLRIYVCMYICIYIYQWYVGSFQWRTIRIDVYKYTPKYIYYVHRYIHTYIHTYVNNIRMYVCMYEWILPLNINSLLVHEEQDNSHGQVTNSCWEIISTRTCIHTYITYVFMYICMYIYWWYAGSIFIYIIFLYI
jgi:hypothetical protein